MSDQETENRLVAKGLVAPRITLNDFNSNIAHTEIVTHQSVTGQVLRWAIITTQSGFAVVGDPSCAVSNENDNQAEGERIAIENTRNKLWPLMGYCLKQKLHDSKQLIPNEEPTIPTNFKDRLVLEQAELKEKLDKLSAFLEKGKPDNLNVHDWKLLRFQQKTMDEYYQILLARLDELK